MAIHSVEAISSELTVGKGLSRTYSTTFQIISDFPAAPETVVTDSRLPQYGEPYVFFDESDIWAFCNEIQHRTDPRKRVKMPEYGPGDMQIHTVVTTHRTQSDESPRGTRSRQESPLDDPPEISGSFTPFRRRTRNDKDRNPIQNSAKVIPEDGVEVDDAWDTLRVAINTPSIDLALRGNARGAVNSEPIWGLAARQVKLMAWNWQILQRGELEYVRNSFEFLISYEEFPTTNVHKGPTDAVGFYHLFHDTGFGYWPGGVDADPLGEYTTIGTIEGDNFEGKLASDGDKLTPQTDDPGWLIYAVEKEVDFNEFGIPNPLPGPFV